MSVRVGINGFGRTGRAAFRAAHERGEDIEWVGINDVMEVDMAAHLLRYDSILGPFPGEVEATDSGIVVDGEEIRVLSERDPAALPWGELGIDISVVGYDDSPISAHPGISLSTIDQQGEVMGGRPSPTMTRWIKQPSPAGFPCATGRRRRRCPAPEASGSVRRSLRR